MSAILATHLCDRRRDSLRHTAGRRQLAGFFQRDGAPRPHCERFDKWRLVGREGMASGLPADQRPLAPPSSRLRDRKRVQRNGRREEDCLRIAVDNCMSPSFHSISLPRRHKPHGDGRGNPAETSGAAHSGRPGPVETRKCKNWGERYRRETATAGPPKTTGEMDQPLQQRPAKREPGLGSIGQSKQSGVGRFSVSGAAGPHSQAEGRPPANGPNTADGASEDPDAGRNKRCSGPANNARTADKKGGRRHRPVPLSSA